MLHDLQSSPAPARFAEDEHVWIKEAAEVQIVCVANLYDRSPPPHEMANEAFRANRAFLGCDFTAPLPYSLVCWWYLLCLCASPAIHGCCLATANQEASG